MKQMDQNWAGWLKTLDPKGIDKVLRYEDTSGGFWTTRPYDALVQAFNHSTHHRGQIASLLRKSGNEPMRVDYIAFHRTKEA